MRLPFSTPTDVLAAAGRPFPPTILDVRRAAAFERDPFRIPMAIRCDPAQVGQFATSLEPWRSVVAYCAHGHEVSQQAASTLRALGFDATFLEGGLEGWRAAGAPVDAWRPPTRWVTRERPKIDRIACPWLVRRFVDASAQFFYVAPREVSRFARENDATPFDVPDVEYSHVQERCSFDAFVARHAPDDAALGRLAAIVRAADTDTLAQDARAAGLLAISLGLGRGIADDATLLRHGLLVYDALYAWCREATDERHGWNLQALRA
jgi:rhodanese-related sulfurtransferase